MPLSRRIDFKKVRVNGKNEILFKLLPTSTEVSRPTFTRFWVLFILPSRRHPNLYFKKSSSSASNFSLANKINVCLLKEGKHIACLQNEKIIKNQIFIKR
jgi:hypothetical protein